MVSQGSELSAESNIPFLELLSTLSPIYILNISSHPPVFLARRKIICYNLLHINNFGGTFVIRLAQEKDLQGILDIYNDAVLHTTAVYTYKAQTLESRKLWYKQKLEDGFPVIVYELDNKVVGFATFGPFRPWPAYKYSIEHSIYVDSSYRRKGIATSLLKEIIAMANEREYMTLIAGIDAANEKSIAMHEKFGFVHSGTITKAGYKFNTWLDLAFYQLNLNGPKNPIED
jgi:L-amino acid N-acyltransferase